MKKSILSLIALFVFQLILAQAPNKMSYQAVVRDSDNNLVSNQAVGLKVSILAGAVDGSVVYEETHNTNSNINGLVSVVIGEGSNQSGNFATVSWAASSHFIKTEIDPTGGTNYTITGTQQLLSVPYAMHANTADNLGGVEGTEVGEMLYWDGNNWVTIPLGTKGQSLVLCDENKPQWGYCISTALNGPITSQTARIKGEINGASEISEIGICYSTNPNPTTSDFKKAQNLVTYGVWTTNIGNLTPNTTYYARAYAISDTGTRYGNEVNFTTTNTLGLGDYYPEQGGFIIYLLQPTDPGYDPNTPHGLIVSVSYNGNATASWVCTSTFLGGTSTDLFTGLNNTNIMLNNCQETGNQNNIADKCNEYSSHGFNDWYAPSLNELEQIYFIRGVINATIIELNLGGPIQPDRHWSSSEIDANTASSFSFGNGTIGNNPKSHNMSIRPIRTF
jgi:hypothetical protein